MFSYFLEEYKRGRTPNPDVLCNREIKFRAFLEFALRNGAEWMATGHFCRIGHGEEGVRLLKGADPQKDQSYFLHMLDQAQLQRALFPVGGMTKAQVRAMAREAGLSTAQKKDSTGVCFIGERNFKRFLQQYLPATPGEMVDEKGRVVGKHDGLMYYTLATQGAGYRRPAATDGRGFVIGKDLSGICCRLPRRGPSGAVLQRTEGIRPALYRGTGTGQELCL